MFFIILFASCNGQNKPKNASNTVLEYEIVHNKEISISYYKANTVKIIDNNIRSLFQDKKGNYWFGTNGAGVYRYDGITLAQFTVKDGLSDNQIQSIQEDKSGNLWFGTGIYGVSRFDGQTFTTYSSKENLQQNTDFDSEWKIKTNDLWFYAGGGVYRYNGIKLAYLPLNKTVNETKNSKNSPYEFSRYGVYSILKDKKGNLWIGTQGQGVCRFDGKSFTWFSEKGLAGPAVLALFEDKKGNIWFGNNGSGLFCYDGKSLSNFTHVKGLSNAEFKTTGKSGPGTLARIYSINEDKTGNLWFGTVDAGVWRYDGINLTNYTTKNGLTSNAINTIYKDKNGDLWFGTDGDGICRFNGKTFEKFEVK